jgi:predicted transcriptional regulator
MQRRNLSDRIIKLDRNIRFVGVVNSRGEVIEGGFQHGVQPLLEGTDEQQMYIQSLSNMTMFQNYSDRLGKVRYSITEHEKVTLMTFPLDDGILCVSASPKANINKIRNKVSKVIKERSAAKKKKKKKPTK